MAGVGTAGSQGDGGAAVSARLNFPAGLAMDGIGTLYIADHSSHRIRKITSDGRVSTVAGTGTAGLRRPGRRSPAERRPYGIAVDCVDTLYIADHNNHRIRRITSATMAGRPESGTVVSWANVRSRLRMGVLRESLKGGTEIHQSLPSPRAHQQWRLIPVGSVTGTPRAYEIANRNSGLLLRVATNAPAAIRQHGAQGDHRDRQWQLIPV
ncbi:RICIN domain-containing protein [Streptomyces anulatus]|uniref:RICIN domain-containing protein n=1 Tax=Streptomyces anulatus TaxID=1892 RepID=UPI003869ECBD